MGSIPTGGSDAPTRFRVGVFVCVACGAAGVPGAGGPGCGAGLLGVPVGGGPPASRPRREPLARRVVSKPGQAPPPPTGTAVRPSGPSGALRTSGAGSLMVGLARRLEARLQLLIINFARNSFVAHSNIECASLELQRFWGVSKNDRDKLRAKCGWRWCRRRPRVAQSGPVG